MAILEEIYNNGEVQEQFMDVPGFSFYPTEEELLGFYLKKRVESGYPLNFDIIIPTLDLYRYDPWELPGLDRDVGEWQWFFFVPRDHQKSCPRPNRLTASGFWKATGSERAIRNEQFQCIGLKKTLVFYKGKGLAGQKMDWIMNEYRLPDFTSSTTKKRVDIVLCRIYRKAASRNSIEQRAKLNHVEKEELGYSASDEHGEKLCNSFTPNSSCLLSNPMLGKESSSLHHQNQEGVCSSDLQKTKNEDSLFECLEPIMFSEGTVVLKAPEPCKPPHLKLPALSMDCLFMHGATASPWADNKNEWTPCALQSTP